MTFLGAGAPGAGLLNPGSDDRSGHMVRAILILAVLCAVGCGADPLTRDGMRGTWVLSMDFQVASGMVGTADFAGDDGTWNAINPENSYTGHVVTGDYGRITFWFGDVGKSFQLRTVAHFEGNTIVAGSVDPAIDATVRLTR